MSDPREIAVKALCAVDNGAWSDLYLANAIEKARFDHRDAALCTAICSGVLQNRTLLDYHLASFSKQKLNKVPPYVLNIMRAAAYQIEFMDRVPQSAAVNTAVNLAHRSTNPRSSGFVNAVLRRLCENVGMIPDPESPDAVSALSVKYSHPRALVEYFANIVGLEETERLLKLDNEAPPICARVNTLISTTDEAVELLEEQGVKVRRHEYLEDALYLKSTGNIERIKAFSDGKITIQDVSSQLCVLALAPKPGADVLDSCAAPGGKSFYMAALMENRGAITACDIYPSRVKLIADGAKRLGVKILSARECDATKNHLENMERYDYILADVPCSGMGVIRRKPEIRYKKPSDVDGLPAIQSDILENVSGYLKSGGVMVYSTCTLIKKENEQIVDSFLKKHSEFRLMPFELPGGISAESGMTTLWPQRTGTDGFFIAKIGKK